jgi:hypothetical protein
MAAASSVPAEVLGPRDFDGWFTEVEAMWKGTIDCSVYDRVILACNCEMMCLINASGLCKG